MTRRRVKATSAAPPNPTLTEAQLAAELEREAVAKHQLARKVAKYTMLLAHGCTGTSCTSPEHGEDRQRRDEVLIALGILPDPVPSAKGKYAWGQAKGAKAG